MKFALVIIAAFLFTGIQAQTKVDVPLDTLQHWLQEGTYDAQIYKLQPNSKSAEIQRTMRDSISTKIEWFRAYIKEADPKKELPYHKNLGVTEETYNEFLKLKNETEYVDRGNAKFQIFPDSLNKNCAFSSVGFLVAVDFISFDYTAQTISVNSKFSQKGTLSPVESIKDGTAKNRFESKFHGYKWLYESSEFGSGKGTRYEVVLLHLTDTDEIYMEITTTTSANGVVGNPNAVPFKWSRAVAMTEDAPDNQHEPTKLGNQ